jgi:hypothetical protein
MVNLAFCPSATGRPRWTDRVSQKGDAMNQAVRFLIAIIAIVVGAAIMIAHMSEPALRAIPHFIH